MTRTFRLVSIAILALSIPTISAQLYSPDWNPRSEHYIDRVTRIIYQYDEQFGTLEPVATNGNVGDFVFTTTTFAGASVAQSWEVRITGNHVLEFCREIRPTGGSAKDGCLDNGNNQGTVVVQVTYGAAADMYDIPANEHGTGTDFIKIDGIRDMASQTSAAY